MIKEKKYKVTVKYTKTVDFEVSDLTGNKAIEKVKRLMEHYSPKYEDKVYQNRERKYKVVKMD